MGNFNYVISIGVASCIHSRVTLIKEKIHLLLLFGLYFQNKEFDAIGIS